ncbi:hypothetical protein NPIL_573211, partial [Nephila pilipes]
MDLTQHVRRIISIVGGYIRYKIDGRQLE